MRTLPPSLIAPSHYVPSPAASPLPSVADVSKSSAPSRRSLRPRLRVPGHFNNSELLRFIFGSATATVTVTGAEDEEKEEGEERQEVAADEAGGAAAEVVSEGGRPLYPFTRHLALIVVRDLHRLCLTKADRVRGRCTADGHLAPVTPPHPVHFHSDDVLFPLLLGRLLLHLTGIAATPSQLTALRLQSHLIGRVTGRLDTESKKLYLEEAYDLSSDGNAELPPSVLSSLAAFSGRQARSWFSDRRDPLSHLRLSLPLSQLEGLGRLQCPQCRRKSAMHRPAYTSPPASPSFSTLLTVSLPCPPPPQGESLLPRLYPRGCPSLRPPSSRRPPRLL